MEPLLTIPEVAELLKVKPRTIRRWIELRKIAFVNLPGGDKRFKAEWLESWIDQRTIKPVKQVA